MEKKGPASGGDGKVDPGRIGDLDDQHNNEQLERSDILVENSIKDTKALAG